MSISLIVLATILSVNTTEANPNIFKKNKKTKKNILPKKTLSPFSNIDGIVSVDEAFSEENNSIDFYLKDTFRYDLKISDPVISKRNDTSFEINSETGKIYKKIFDGKRINIAIIGVDSRIGERHKRADANHILSILPDKGKIEIFTIPRDTYIDCGFEDSSNNKVSNAFSKLGKRRFFKKIALIAGLDRIHYHAQIGFSQTIGMLELFGFKESGKTLQVLRSRKSFRGGDWQRCFNQANFIGKILLKSVNSLDEISAGILISGGLAMVESDIPLSKALEIYLALKDNNFSDSLLSVKLRPQLGFRAENINLADENNIDSLYEIIYNKRKSKRKNKRSRKNNSSDEVSDFVAAKLQGSIMAASLDSARRPSRVISKLKTYFKQKAWLQVKNKITRADIRNEICWLLANAYEKNGKQKESVLVVECISTEENLFNSTGFNAERLSY